MTILWEIKEVALRCLYGEVVRWSINGPCAIKGVGHNHAFHCPHQWKQIDEFHIQSLYHDLWCTLILYFLGCLSILRCLDGFLLCLYAFNVHLCRPMPPQWLTYDYPLFTLCSQGATTKVKCVNQVDLLSCRFNKSRMDSSVTKRIVTVDIRSQK